MPDTYFYAGWLFPQYLSDDIINHVSNMLDKKYLVGKEKYHLHLPQKYYLLLTSLMEKYWLEFYIEENEKIYTSIEDKNYIPNLYTHNETPHPHFQIIMENIFPVPKANVPVENILKFKEKHRDELSFYLNIIDELQYRFRIGKEKEECFFFRKI